MIRFAICTVAALGLAGCASTTPSPAVVSTVNSVVKQGQLYCAKATTYGPLVAAVIDAADSKAVSVVGKTQSYVAQICAVLGGIPVSPPAVPAAAPTVAVVLPTHA